MRRLSPGRSNALCAVVNADGEIEMEPAEMAKILLLHWADVCKERRVNDDLLDKWLAEDGGAGFSENECRTWHILRQHVEEAIKEAPNSTPGPDGVPFGAWKRLGTLGTDVLFRALLELTAEDRPADWQEFMGEDGATDGFNVSSMVFIPKAATTTTADGGKGFGPGDVRPINICNADNRILATAVRKAVEQKLTIKVAGEQRGFVGQRSLLSNLVDVDESMMRTALGGEEGAAIFSTSRRHFQAWHRSTS